MEEFFQVGIVSSTHGVRGEVKVYPTTDEATRFRRLKSVIVKLPSGERSLEIEGVKFFKQMVIVKFKGIDTMDEALKLRQGSLMIGRDQAVRLRKDEYFIADLIGIRVLNEDGNPIGVLREVLPTGANDVYQIDLDDGRELLLPAIKQCILDVNVEEGYLKIHILEGLLEEE